MPIQFPVDRTVTMTNLNCRREARGDDDIPAVDVSVTLQAHPMMLDAFAPGLRYALFSDEPVDGATEGLDLNEGSTPFVRCPKLRLPVRVKHEQTGMRAIVRYGIAGDGDLVLDLVKLHKVRIEAIAEGPACEIGFTLSTSNEVTEKVVGRLAMLQGHEVSLVLEAPEVAQVQEGQQDLAGDDFPERPTFPQPPREMTAEELFAGSGDAG